ncbi:uncharacterized protein LOC113369747 [Ctenocephalides felis]|uniref:uncharacterized protein LOC113369747 n=1 Tax=Ctenocephalides felis TaxID=7515 RepID=UPI000E6E56D5|nr:uncharacterized protein LOC113369747 [Ctenocephalides felis]
MIVNSRAESSGSYPFQSSAESFANIVQESSPGYGDLVASGGGYGDVDADADADPDQMLNYAAGKEVTVLKDDAYSRIKHGLGADDNHVLVIDRCGRLAYQIINPWSLIQFPYVKAAILSTYHDEPCGTCKIQIPDETTLRQNNTSEEPVTKEIPTISSDFLESQINFTLNETLKQDAMNNSNSGVFILNEEGSEINLTQQVDQEPISRSTVYEEDSTSDIFDSTSTTIDHFENDKSMESTTFDTDDGNNNNHKYLTIARI